MNCNNIFFKGKLFYGCRNYPDGCKFFRFAPNDALSRKKKKAASAPVTSSLNMSSFAPQPLLTSAPVFQQAIVQPIIQPVFQPIMQPIIQAPIVQAIVPPMPQMSFAPTNDDNEQEEDTPYCECDEPTVRKTIEKAGRNQGLCNTSFVLTLVKVSNFMVAETGLVVANSLDLHLQQLSTRKRPKQRQQHLHLA